MQHTTESLITQYNESGLTQKEFCHRQNIPFSTFQYHLKKPRKNRTDTFPTFLPLTPRPHPKSKRIIIIEGVDIQDLSSILASLEN